MPQLLIFTDLDGTLLDHHSYSYQAALPALQQLKKRQIPLIICTSKTAAEVAKLRRELEIQTPYIVENGTAVLLPADWAGNDFSEKVGTPEHAHYLGSDYAEILKITQKLRLAGNYNFKGFGDYSVAELAEETGLALDDAELAKQRLSSEPLRWDDTAAALESFTRQLQAEGLQLVRGGRYYHVLSGADKGVAVRWLLRQYQQTAPQKSFFSVALGDGPNDKSLLEAVDLGIVIPSASGLSLQPQGVETRSMTEPGPVGWNHAILQLLNEFDQKHN